MKRNTDKIINTRWIYKFSTIIFLLLTFRGATQDSLASRPAVTSLWKEYQTQVLHDSLKKMIGLKANIPGVVLDIRYATVNNFMRRRMYADAVSETFMRKAAAEALARVQLKLAEEGLGLKIFDAYRPFSVTEKFWELVRDERYVANPRRGSAHNRGLAVDLTIIELSSGKELDMGTGFDNFTDTAHHSFMALSPEVLRNRSRLRSLMTANGFKPLETEWWHYTFVDSRSYELLDISFSELIRREL